MRIFEEVSMDKSLHKNCYLGILHYEKFRNENFRSLKVVIIKLL